MQLRSGPTSHATNNVEGIGHAFRGCAAGSTAMRLEVAQRAQRPCDLIMQLRSGPTSHATNNAEGIGHAFPGCEGGR